MAPGKELRNTLLFVGAAVATMVFAIMTRPQTDQGNQVDVADVGQIMFPELAATSDVTGLEVLSFNEELGSLKPFQIEQEREGEWVIPSRQGYPADAQDRVARAASMFVDLKVLAVVRDADHQTLGVVEPEFGKTEIGDEGVGTLVKVSGTSGDKTNAPLADLIIGKPVKDVYGQHYARRPGKSKVYRVEIDPSQLSTDFVDWIDPTLLPFPRTEMKNVVCRNYSMLVKDTSDGKKELTLALNYEAELKSQENDEWQLALFREVRDGNLQKRELDASEELNQERIAELANTLDLMSIIDVRRKTGPLSEKLRVGDLNITSPEDTSSLVSRGFYPFHVEDQPSQLFAVHGELLVNIKAGVQFRILLGALNEQSNENLSSASLNRFVMILPQLDELAFPKPDLEELPSDDEEMTANSRKVHVERITKANERKQAEYQQTVDRMRQVVKALRDKYADWYYLVPEETVRKLRIPRSELIVLSEEALEQGFGIEAFRMLQKSGLGSQ